jgi:hypothetical protein
VELEHELADLHRKEAASIFTSGYVSNETGIASIAKLMADCTVISDALNHNSMIEGVRRSGCEKMIWHHGDLGHLEELLKAAGARPKLVVFESVYTMDGEVAPVNAICINQLHPGRSRSLVRYHDCLHGNFLLGHLSLCWKYCSVGKPVRHLMPGPWVASESEGGTALCHW